ncbi:hypothetical protein AgCh_004425 [Apium graveolens]
MLQLLEITGSNVIVRVSSLQLDWGLISALIKRWRQETHTFHLPVGECLITLQDIGVLTVRLGSRMTCIPPGFQQQYPTRQQLQLQQQQPHGNAGQSTNEKSELEELRLMRTLIDVQKGELTMTIQGQDVTFNIFNAMKFPINEEECFKVELVDSVLSSELDHLLRTDALERALTGDSDSEDEEGEKQM